MKREEIIELFPDATDEQISKLLNKHHGELNAARKADTEAAEKAAKSDEQAQTIASLQAQIEKLTADYSASRKANNTAKAVASLMKAGMDEAFATALAAGVVTDDAKASEANVANLATAFTAMETARQTALAQQGLKEMPKPQNPGAGKTLTADVDYAKKLAEGRAAHSTSGTLDSFKQ